MIKIAGWVFISFLSACHNAAFDIHHYQAPFDDVPFESKCSIVVPDDNVADGQTPSDIILEVMNKAGQPIPNKDMSITLSGDNNVVLPCTPTDALGRCRCRVYSTKAEIKTVRVGGFVSTSKAVQFHYRGAQRNAADIVTSGGRELLSSGEKIISSTGIVEESNVIRDAQNDVEIHTSIQSFILVNE